MRIKALCLLFLAAFASIANAEESAGSLGIGVHGVTSDGGTGHPFIQWKAGESMAIEITPVLYAVKDSADTDSSGRSYGLNVGMIKELHKRSGLSIGARIDLGYTYGSDNSRTPQSNSGWRDYNISAGMGPAFEYFVESVRGLSVGAHASLNYEHYRDRYFFSETTYGGNSISNSRGYRIFLSGELLTLRYYF